MNILSEYDKAFRQGQQDGRRVSWEIRDRLGFIRLSHKVNTTSHSCQDGRYARSQLLVEDDDLLLLEGHVDEVQVEQVVRLAQND